MATKGQTISNCRTGEKITWLETAKDTNGQRLVFDFEVKPKGKLPVVHFHPNQLETFEVKQGTFVINLNGLTKVLHPGEAYTIDKGVPHQWWNDSESEPAVMKVTFEPALNTETFLEQFFGLNNDGKTKPDGTPEFLQIMAMVNEYQLYVDGPPLPVQRLMGTVLGGFAQLIGYKKYYPEYSEQRTSQPTTQQALAV